jgi:tRNA A-37 threonylcarbamoyl transferase component Bud32
MRWPTGVADGVSHKRGMKGLRWTIAQGGAQWLPSALVDNPEEFLLHNHPQRLLKESPVRTVAIFSGPYGEFFFKRYKTRGVGEWLKHLVIPSKARTEWQMAHFALRKGIPTPSPLAMAERRKGRFLQDAFLVTQAIVPSSPFIELFPKGRHEDLLARAAHLIRGVHDVGLFHQDLHAGNILVEKGAERLYIIDLHRSRFLKRVSSRRRLWNLAQFFYSLQGWLSPEDERTLLHQYDKGGDIFKRGPNEALRKIKRFKERLYRRHMRSRTKRCLKNSSGFSVARQDGWRIWSRRGWKTEQLLKLMTKHRYIVAQSKSGLIKADRRTAITLFPYKKTRICVKGYRYQGLWQQFKEVFRRSKARRGWLAGNGLVVRGVEGITPQGLLERRRWGFLKEAFLIMETPLGYGELDRYMVSVLEDPLRDRGGKRSFLKSLAGFMADLYKLKIYHGDLKTCNIMVREKETGWDFGVVDWDDVQLDKEIRPRKILKTLIQLNTSAPLFIDMRNRIRFLIYYFNVTKRHNVRDIIQKVIKGSRGRELVYVTREGDVIMAVDWEESCALSSRSSLAKKEL